MRTLCLLLLLPLAATAASGFDDLFAPLAGAHTPGLAVLIRRDGRTVYKLGFGARDLRTFTLIDPSTDFRLASFTKQFTAASIMLLVHDGKLRYDTPLTAILPEFPAWGRAITIRHLLTHTAGLPDYEDFMGGGSWTARHQIGDAEALALIERQPRPKFAPGTSWAYSNSAYVTLGLIVAKVSGRTFPEFLRDRIFAPLGMTRTLAFVNGTNTVPDRAYGYSRRGGDFVDTDQSSTSATLGDGGVYSNLTDLARWDDALARHTLLGEAEMRPALTPVTLTTGAPTRWPQTPDSDNLAPGRPVAYGYGWFLDPLAGRAAMWHTGSTSGFRTFIGRLLKEKITIVILANRTDLDVKDLATKGLERALTPGR